MLGNDIVDLRKAKLESNWRRKGYLDKIFSLQEQDLIATAENQDQMVWLLWSMKEAAYKIVSPLIGERFYNPLAFECVLDFIGCKAHGSVFFQERILFTSSEISEELIYTTALLERGHEYQNHFLSNQQNYIEEFNDMQSNFFLFKNEENLPVVQDLTSEFFPASVSHHGRFLAIAHSVELRVC